MRPLSVEADLGFFDELWDDDGVFFGDGAGLRQVCLEIFVGVSNVHRGSAEDVRRSHEARKPDLGTELLRCLQHTITHEIIIIITIKKAGIIVTL